MSSEKEYRYLTENQLTKNFYTNRSIEDEYTIHICLVTLIDDTVNPFLKFLFQNNNSQYILPSFKLQNNVLVTEPSMIGGNDTDEDEDEENNTIQPIDEEEEEEEEDVFFNTCREHIHAITGIDKDKADNLYRGFVENENHILVIFDLTVENLNIHIDNKYDWGIVNEIITNSIKNVPLSETIYTLFTKNQHILHIYDDNDDHIETPIIGYICQGEYENLSNIYSNETDDTQDNSFILMVENVTHPLLGEVYLFSMNPINNVFDNIKRYVVFNKNAVYVLQPELQEEYMSFIVNEPVVFFNRNTQTYCSSLNPNFICEI
jgi:hypothetical protein